MIHRGACRRLHPHMLVTTLRVARKTRKRVFQKKDVKLIGVDAKAQVHRYDPDGWRLSAQRC